MAWLRPCAHWKHHVGISGEVCASHIGIPHAAQVRNAERGQYAHTATMFPPMNGLNALFGKTLHTL